mgnify:CR=1 FL=1|jgi:hypothetical protein
MSEANVADPSRGEATGRPSLRDSCTGKGEAEFRVELVAMRSIAGLYGAAGHSNRGFAQPQGGAQGRTFFEKGLQLIGKQKYASRSQRGQNRACRGDARRRGWLRGVRPMVAIFGGTDCRLRPAFSHPSGCRSALEDWSLLCKAPLAAARHGEISAELWGGDFFPNRSRCFASPASAVLLGTLTGLLHSLKGGGRKAELSLRAPRSSTEQLGRRQQKAIPQSSIQKRGSVGKFRIFGES